VVRFTAGIVRWFRRADGGGHVLQGRRVRVHHPFVSRFDRDGGLTGGIISIVLSVLPQEEELGGVVFKFSDDGKNGGHAGLTRDAISG
jgi:hypothetical protein